MARDELLGRRSDRTGSTIWYFGPILNLSVGLHFSANAGVDIPLHVSNHGYQSLPEYRAYGGLTFRF
jgi:hypothetical protein